MASGEMQVEVLRVTGWEKYTWLQHGFSTRLGGVSTVYGGEDLNLGFTRDDSPESVRENRRRFAASVSGRSGTPLLTVRQVHGCAHKVIPAGEASLSTADGYAVAEADGLITDVPGILLGIQVADCVPVLVVDTQQRIVAAIHAGWRGTVASIVARGVERLQAEFHTSAGDLVAAIGPSISGCCYTVGAQVEAEFASAFSYASSLFTRGAAGPHLDLAEANRRQLLAAGVAADAIAVLGQCTGCARDAHGRRRYFSHRAERGFTGRAMGAIGVAEA